MFKHLQALQGIADDNGGNRASGFQGYGASVQYVLTQLRAAGYNPTTQVFSFVTFQELSDPVLQEISPTPKTYTQDEFQTMSYSGSGDTGERTITPVDVNLGTPSASNSGCEAADFAGFPAGNIALIQRGTCTFGTKATNAINAPDAVSAVSTVVAPTAMCMIWPPYGSSRMSCMLKAAVPRPTATNTRDDRPPSWNSRHESPNFGLGA